MNVSKIFKHGFRLALLFRAGKLRKTITVMCYVINDVHSVALPVHPRKVPQNLRPISAIYQEYTAHDAYKAFRK